MCYNKINILAVYKGLYELLYHELTFLSLNKISNYERFFVHLLWSRDIRIKILNNIYTNFKCLCIKCQIWYKNLMRHFFETVIFRILQNMYDIDNLIIFRGWSKKLALKGSEPMTSVFHSHALSKWDIRPWVYLVFIANMYRYFNFSFFFLCPDFIFILAFT